MVDVSHVKPVKGGFGINQKLINQITKKLITKSKYAGEPIL